jgi:hypothetical protein
MPNAIWIVYVLSQGCKDEDYHLQGKAQKNNCLRLMPGATVCFLANL